ncbi:coagulation factor V [Osmerus eperlanus]|uniref:coagulation factor V n=1 Tax=Osmerus eperlanus TaxID=29151 RepID=UPI002E13AAEF
MKPCPWAAASCLLPVLAVFPFLSFITASQDGARIRRYYIAAVPILWDYSDGHGHGRPGPSYKKVVFREYEEGFKQAKTHPPWLGLLGPTLRGQVGETIVVTFKNMADKQFSIHPHGIAYGKQSEGAHYFDNTSQQEKDDDVVPPYSEHTYYWEVNSEVAPQEADPPCITYTYQSHFDIVKDYNAGLIGALLICKPGSLDETGQQASFHHEYVFMFGVFDESLSRYSAVGEATDNPVKHTINGYSKGAIPGLSICAHTSVSLHLVGMSSDPEVFSVHMNGQMLQHFGHQVSSVGLVSGTATSAQMTAVYPGRWLLSSYTNKHQEAGMHGFVDVVSCKGFDAPKRKLTIQQKRESQEWTYYIAAEEVVWDYAPNMPAYMDGDFKFKYLKQGPQRIGKRYKKAVYTQYTDDSFTKRAEKQQRKMEVGIIGPVIRAQIRDVIKIVFKNKASQPYSIYPHGLTIDKAAEGANYPAGGNQTHGVQPGQTHTYVWRVIVEDEPFDSDSRCLTRMYHSAVDTPRDIASGLIGPLLICKSQSLNIKNVQLRADKEQHAMFAIFDENRSWYLEDNIQSYCDPKKVRKDDPDFYQSNVIHSINGYVFESGPVLGFCNGEIVTWHVSSVGAHSHIQTSTFYGHVFELNNRTEDFLSLYPMTGETIKMDMDNIGVWIISSLNSHETTKGMRVKFQDVECFHDYVYEYEDRAELEAEPKVVFDVWLPEDIDAIKEEKQKHVTEQKKIDVEIDEDTEKWADLLGIRSLSKQAEGSSVEQLDLSFLDKPERDEAENANNLSNSVPASILPSFFNTTFDGDVKKVENHTVPEPALESLNNMISTESLNFSLWGNTTEPLGTSRDQLSSSAAETRNITGQNISSLLEDGNMDTEAGKNMSSNRDRTGRNQTFVSDTLDLEDQEKVTRGDVFSYTELSEESSSETDLLVTNMSPIPDSANENVTDLISNKTGQLEPLGNATNQTHLDVIVFRELKLQLEEQIDNDIFVSNMSNNTFPPPLNGTALTGNITSQLNSSENAANLSITGVSRLNFSQPDEYNKKLDLQMEAKNLTNNNNSLENMTSVNVNNVNTIHLPEATSTPNRSIDAVVNREHFNETYIQIVPLQNVTNSDRMNSSEVSFERREDIFALQVNQSSSSENVSKETNSLAAGNLSIPTSHTQENSSEEIPSERSESIEEVVICLKNGSCHAVRTTPLNPQEEHWSYNATHHAIAMEMPDHMIKYIGNELPKPALSPDPTLKPTQKPKIITEYRRWIPEKGHSMKTKKKKEYKAQPKENVGFSPRGVRPQAPAFSPRGSRPVTNQDDLINKAIVIGIPRPDFSDYELYLPGEHSEEQTHKSKHVDKDDYEYVDFKDPYTHTHFVKFNLDDNGKYFLKTAGEKVRTYFITAEEVEWDYAGYGQRRMEKWGNNSPYTQFTKVIFRGYLDSSFKTPDLRREMDEHLGILGPVIKAEVGETIIVFFRNLASRPYSLHPNGVTYTKQTEGLSYEDESTMYWFKEDNEVLPNSSYTYLWNVNAKAGPKAHESDCRTWAYYSGVNPERDIHSGLIGPLLVCREGTMAKRMVDMREFTLLFMTFDESQSWYYERNRERLEKTNRRALKESTFKFHAINGIIFSLKGLRMYSSQLVRWHLINMGSPRDLHSVHFHGQTFLIQHMHTYRQGVFPLLPGGFATLEMRPSKPGLWQLETEVGLYQQQGMQTLFLVLDDDCFHPLGLESRSVPDQQITASSHRGYWAPSLARLNNHGKINAWSTDKAGSWIQVDFQRSVVISQVATQGAKEMFRSQYVLNYTISYSTDRRKWTYYKGDSDHYAMMTFTGNREANEVKVNTFFPPLIGRYVRLHPLSYYNMPTLRMDFYGCQLDGCSVPLGMESKLIEDHHITASSTATSWYSGKWYPSLARLNNQGIINAWQAKYNDAGQWLQIELAQVKKITGIVTQGAKALGKEMFISSYSLEHSDDGIVWNQYTDDDEYLSKVFPGNTDNSGHVKNYIHPPIFSRFIRIKPQTWRSSITMRVELLGCDFE